MKLEPSHVQLLAYLFPPGAELEGQLLGAMERAESGGAVKILDVLYVARDAESGELHAFAGRGRQQGGLVTSLVGFRLDPGERTRATEKALRAYERPAEANPLRQLADALPPGGALAAVLVEHVWARATHDAAQRGGGEPLLSGSVDERELSALCSQLLSAIGTGTARTPG